MDSGTCREWMVAHPWDAQWRRQEVSSRNHLPASPHGSWQCSLARRAKAMLVPLPVVTTPDERGAGRAVTWRCKWQYINPAIQNMDLASLKVSKLGLDTALRPPALLGVVREAATAGAAQVFISRLDTLPGFGASARLSSSNPFPCKFSRRNSSCFSPSAMTTLFSAQSQAQPSSHSSPRSLRYSPTGNPGI